MPSEIWNWNLRALAIYARHLSAAQAEINAEDVGVLVELDCRLIVEGEPTNQYLVVMDDNEYGLTERDEP
jgi:hypothetical protein